MSQFAQFDSSQTRPTKLGREFDFTIRSAEAADVETLAGIAAEREGQPVAIWHASFEKYFDRSLDRATHQLLVAVRAGITLGYAKSQYFAPVTGAPENVAPAGWYLTGVIVRPEHRRLGIGLGLTTARLDRIARTHTESFYFCNAKNAVSIALHERLGFAEHTRDFWFPKVHFEGGSGILFRKAMKVQTT